MSLKNLGAALVVVLLVLVAAPTTASAATITLSAVNGNLYQQGVQNPCVFANQSCQQPAGWNSTDVPNGGGVDNWDLTVSYSGQTLLNKLNGGSLLLGLDINQATGAGPQELLGFAMYKNNVLTDTFSGAPGNVPASNNGNGYADYLLGGFSPFIGTDTIQFRFQFANANDGAENVFLISGPGTNSPVPEPATMLLLGTGLLAVARARRNS